MQSDSDGGWVRLPSMTTFRLPSAFRYEQPLSKRLMKITYYKRACRTYSNCRLWPFQWLSSPMTSDFEDEPWIYGRTSTFGGHSGAGSSCDFVWNLRVIGCLWELEFLFSFAQGINVRGSRLGDEEGPPSGEELVTTSGSGAAGSRIESWA